MKARQTVLALAGAAALCLFLGGVAGPQTSPPWQGLAGVWTLDASLSEAPKAEGREGDQHRGPRGGGGSFGGRGGGLGGPGGGMGGGGDLGGYGGGMEGSYGGEMEPGGSGGRGGGRAPGDRPRFLGGAAAFKLDVLDKEIRLIGDDGRVRMLAPDGQPVERSRGFVTVTETATWENGRLVVTSSDPKGLLVTETLGLAEDGSGHLVHTVQVTHQESGTPRTARWVYERSTDGAKADTKALTSGRVGRLG